MELTYLVIVLLVMVSNFALLWALNRAYKREKQRFLDVLKLYFEQTGENELSEFGLLVNSVSDTFAQRLLASLKGSELGLRSVEAKNLSRLEGDITQDETTAANPLLGALLSNYPSVAKRLAKNPQLLPLIQGVLAKSSLKGPAGQGGRDGRSSTFEQELNSWR